MFIIWPTIILGLMKEEGPRVAGGGWGCVCARWGELVGSVAWVTFKRVIIHDDDRGFVVITIYHSFEPLTPCWIMSESRTIYYVGIYRPSLRFRADGPVRVSRVTSLRFRTSFTISVVREICERGSPK